MAISRFHPGNASVYMGLSTDTKPTGISAGVGNKFIETDTLKVFLFMNTNVWVQIGTMAAANSIASVGDL